MKAHEWLTFIAIALCAAMFMLGWAAETKRIGILNTPHEFGGIALDAAREAEFYDRLKAFSIYGFVFTTGGAVMLLVESWFS
jgi:hypothetical protein